MSVKGKIEQSNCLPVYLPLVCERVVPHMPLSVFARCHACNLPECAPECGQRIETALLCHLLQCIVGVFLKHGDALLLDSQFVDVVIEALADWCSDAWPGRRAPDSVADKVSHSLSFPQACRQTGISSLRRSLAPLRSFFPPR